MGGALMASPQRRVGPVVRALAVLALAGLCGCRAPRGGLPPQPLTSCDGGHYPPVERPVADVLSITQASHAPRPGARPLHVLALTGGVEGAPYAAGVLTGWTRAGTRPTFDVVTGISSGALLGAYAFLGPKYDDDLRRLVLTLKSSDLFRFRPLLGPLLHGSFGETTPAERLLRQEVHAGFLADLRQAHADGRRFFVGTMTLQTKRLVIWDVGAIASSGRPDADELVRKLLLAAFTYPGFAPPVEINIDNCGRCYQEEHCDAGTVSMAFVRFGPGMGWPEAGEPVSPGWLAGSNLYVLASRKLYPEPAEVPRRPLVRATTAMTAILQALTAEQLKGLHALCAVSGMRFHMLSVPQDYDLRPVTFRELFPADAAGLFECGQRVAAGGPAWRTAPPGAGPGEESVPRDGGTVEACR